MIDSRDLNDLNPKVKDMCEAFIAKCKDEGIDILITSTYRDGECQDALYAKGDRAGALAAYRAAQADGTTVDSEVLALKINELDRS